MGAEFYYNCLCWQKDKPLDFEAGRREAEEIEDLEEKEKILGIISSLEDMGLDSDSFYHREGTTISLGSVEMLIAAYQGHGDPDECNSLFKDLDNILNSNDVLKAIGFSNNASDLIASFYHQKETKSYIQGLIDAHQDGRFDIYIGSVKNLSLEEARIIGFRGKDLDLSSLTILDDEIAKEIANCTGRLHLGVKQLSDQAAENLSKHKGALSIYKIEHLSDAAAESFSKHEGELLLGGLNDLSDIAAECLSKHQGDLNLPRLAHLNDKSIKSLAKVNGNLCLGLLQLSNTAAKSLSKHIGNLELSDLNQLSDEAAESLSNHQGSLGLCNVTELSDDAVESLSKVKGLLFLGISELTDASALSLSKHVGDLTLSGLSELTDEAAEILSKHQGSLDLCDLSDLSETALKSLARVNGNLGLGITDFTEEALKSFTKLKGYLLLNGIMELNEETASSLCRYAVNLKFPWFGSDISDAVAEIIAAHKGKIHFQNGIRLSEAGLKLLKNNSDISIDYYEII